MATFAVDLERERAARRALTLVGADRLEADHGLRFLTPKELRTETPAEPEWLWGGYLAFGCLAVIAGKPKVGKSTLATSLAVALASGAEAFVGRAIRPTPVVYVAEEGASTWLSKVDAEPSDLRVLVRENAWPKPSWPDLVAAAVQEAEAAAAGLLVIDTLPFWAALAGDGEKDAGVMLRAFEPLVEAASTGLAVLVVHHHRKGGGDDGDALRGSSAIAGSPDVILELERLPGDDPPPRQRLLAAVGRWPQTPPALIVEHDAGTRGWRLVDQAPSKRSARAAGDRARLLEALAQAPDGLTRGELTEALDADWRQFKSELDNLENVTRVGAGKKGEPHRWMLCADAGAQHVHTNRVSAPDVSGVSFPVGEDTRNGENLGQQSCTETDDAWLAAMGELDTSPYSEENR